MLIKRLPLTYPLVNCYPSSSDAIAILQSYINIYPWILNNFIQLFEVKKDVLDFFDFALVNNLFLMYSEVDFNLILKKWNKISDFIVDAVEDDYYVRIFVNVSKIPLYRNDSTYYHDIMIYGYDKDENMFCVADHFAGGKYSFEMCSFEEINSSYDIKNKSLPYDLEHTRYIQLIKPDMGMVRLRYDFASQSERNYMCSFNVGHIKSSINDYINSVPTKYWFTRYPAMDLKLSKNHDFGIDCYNLLNRHIKNLEDNNNVHPFAIQSFYVQYNHKKIMIERLEYMDKKKLLKNAKRHIYQYVYIKDKSKLMLNLFIKLSLKTNNNKNFDKIKTLCAKIKKDEKGMLCDILEDII